MREHASEQSTRVPSQESRKPYHTPSLASYGPVEKLTQGGSGAGLEGMSGMTML